MKILFICTAHNSLSQRLSLALSSYHNVTIELAISEEAMISAAALARPELIICPFLTTFVPKQIYETYLTLIIHPGPPGDAGPSSLDWVLMGDDGSIDDPEQCLSHLKTAPCEAGRTHWGVTVLQADEEFDAGPVWAWDQFPIDIDQPGLTKSAIYRGAITRAAVTATLAAITRITNAASVARQNPTCTYNKTACRHYSPSMTIDPSFGERCVSNNMPFQGGKLHHRPLLKAADRDFNVTQHTAQQISRRIRCGDSQPGVLTKLLGPNMYVYGGIIDEAVGQFNKKPIKIGSADILAIRDEAICIATCDQKGIWITHVRRPKSKKDQSLWPKVPATLGLTQLGLLDAKMVHQLQCPLSDDWSLSSTSTLQQVWVDFKTDTNKKTAAYLHFDFYNGAMSTTQCARLIDAMDYIIARSSTEDPVHAVVLMAGSYFSNGIALNVIENSSDPATESWLNINRIDDVVRYLLYDFPSHGILTFAAIRGNAAAGGVALATACDFVIAGSDVVLNPAYRALGLHGSEYHSISYTARCGKKKATEILRAMKPMSASQAQKIGLVDYVFPGSGTELDERIKYHVSLLLKPGVLQQGYWKAGVDLSATSLDKARDTELSEMRKDFWGPRAERYHTRRFNFVRKAKATHTPLRFATHRRRSPNGIVVFDEEELESFDDVEYYQRQALSKSLEHDNKDAAAAAEGDDSSTSTLPAPLTPIIDDAVDFIPFPTNERKMSTVFLCYYKPVDEEERKLNPPILGGATTVGHLPLTPPFSPMPDDGLHELPFVPMQPI